MEPRPVSHSQTTITELMIPSYANFGGKIHGGILLSLMDKVAYACASKHAGNYCVTVSADGIEFLEAVEVGDLVSLFASVNYVGRTSMIIGIKTIAENVKLGSVKHTNISYFTMVAKDDHGQPTEVPPLLLETKEEIRRFMESIKRKELKNLYKDEFHNEKSKLKVETNLAGLKGERCVLNMR